MPASLDLSRVGVGEVWLRRRCPLPRRRRLIPWSFALLTCSAETSGPRSLGRPGRAVTGVRWSGTRTPERPLQIVMRRVGGALRCCVRGAGRRGHRELRLSPARCAGLKETPWCLAQGGLAEGGELSNPAFLPRRGVSCVLN